MLVSCTESTHAARLIPITMLVTGLGGGGTWCWARGTVAKNWLVKRT